MVDFWRRFFSRFGADFFTVYADFSRFVRDINGEKKTSRYWWSFSRLAFHGLPPLDWVTHFLSNDLRMSACQMCAEVETREGFDVRASCRTLGWLDECWAEMHAMICNPQTLPPAKWQATPRWYDKPCKEIRDNPMPADKSSYTTWAGNVWPHSESRSWWLREHYHASSMSHKRRSPFWSALSFIIKTLLSITNDMDTEG